MINWAEYLLLKEPNFSAGGLLISHLFAILFIFFFLMCAHLLGSLSCLSQGSQSPEEQDSQTLLNFQVVFFSLFPQFTLVSCFLILHLLLFPHFTLVFVYMELILMQDTCTLEYLKNFPDVLTCSILWIWIICDAHSKQLFQLLSTWICNWSYEST